MYRLFLALRYLWSRPISWVSMVGIWLSVTALLATVSIMTGFLRDTRDMIRGTTADMILTPRAEYRGTRQVTPPASFDDVSAAALSIDGVEAAAPHLLRPALIRVPDVDQEQVVGNRKYWELNFVQVVGVDPTVEGAATGFLEWIRPKPPRPGSLRPVIGVADAPDPDDPFVVDKALIEPRYRNLDLPVVLIGDRVYRFFNLTRGRVITLVTMPDSVDVEDLKALSQRFVVGGAFRTGHQQTDQSTVFMDLERAQEFAETYSDATEICVRVADGVELDAVKVALEAELAAKALDVDVETWEDRHATFLGAVENERSILGFLLFFFVAVACFNVFATLTIMVTDKTRDIGVLNSMGATHGGILSVFVRCGAVMALVSSAVGTFTGVLVAQKINVINGWLEQLFGFRIFRPDVYTFDAIPVEIQPWFVVLVFVATNVFAILCAFLPALRAARMDPVKALRHE